MKNIIILIFTLALSLNASTLIKEYRYMASDSDSKKSAKNQALKILKNLVIEETGTGIATHFEEEEKIEDKSISSKLRLGVKSFTSSYIQSKIIDESWDGSSYYLKASITIDEDGIYEKLKLHYKQLKAESISDELETMIENISTKDQVNELINKALTLEFTQDIGSKAHLKILRLFTINKIYDENYRGFLIKTLKAIKYPSWDIRTKPILNYLRGSRAYNKNEREVLAGILEYTKVSQSGNYLAMMLTPNTKVCDDGAQELMQEYLELLNNSKAGLPIYSNLSYEFDSILRAYSSTINPKCSTLGSEAILEIIKSDEAQKLQAKQWINTLRTLGAVLKVSSLKQSKKLLPLVEVSASKLPENANAKRAIEGLYSKTKKEFHPELTQILTPKIRNIYKKEKLYSGDIEFCITNGITIAEKVFSLEEYYNRLRSDTNKSNRRDYVEGIIYYGEKNAGDNHQAYIDSLKFLYAQHDDYHLEMLIRVMEKIGYEDIDSLVLLNRFVSSKNPNLSRRSRKYLSLVKNKK